ncbi:cell division suppressor protein YneA [Anaeromicropila populeti]|uniref:LysM domain-containing protein n=1 Tax=Anaeromicropila populeti TaxID=37658 RepID=A0A1I6L1H2_9FIRM|nr:LysM peptidoglycan-binding domain-containing protein [Anaeromicropila populeti]SFR97314.1 LysM domain-containing protein [Anaeromicropila populeti]
MKGRFIIIIILSVILVSCCISITVLASDPQVNNMKKVDSVYIQKGDTLWEIAAQYYTDEQESMDDFIIEIKNCNQLTSDTIHAGRYIIIPYYESQ